jgi:hypothetical protein
VIEGFGTERVADTVASAALESIAVAFDSTVHHQGRLARAAGGNEVMGLQDCGEGVSLGNPDHIPIHQNAQLEGGVRDILSGETVLSADTVGVNRGLIPVEVQYEVGDTRDGGGGEGFIDPPGGHTRFSLEDVDPGRLLCSVGIEKREGKPGARGDSEPGGTCGEGDERNERGRMSIEGKDVKLSSHGREVQGVASESEEVLEAKATLFRGLEAPCPSQEVSEGESGIEAEGLVTGSHHEAVSVVRIGATVIDLERMEQEADESGTGGEGSSGMSGLRCEVVQGTDQGPEGKEELLERGEGLEIDRRFLWEGGRLEGLGRDGDSVALASGERGEGNGCDEGDSHHRLLGEKSVDRDWCLQPHRSGQVILPGSAWRRYAGTMA